MKLHFASMRFRLSGTVDRRISNDVGWNRFARSFLKQTEYIHSMFDVRWSTLISFFFDLTGRFFCFGGGWADT
jgi:hypothetical protein